MPEEAVTEIYSCVSLKKERAGSSLPPSDPGLGYISRKLSSEAAAGCSTLDTGLVKGHFSVSVTLSAVGLIVES